MPSQPAGTDAAAVCAKCAEPKTRALDACNSCGFTPATEAAIARSLILSRQFSSAEELAQRAADIRTGTTLLPAAAILARARAVAQAILAKGIPSEQMRRPQAEAPAAPVAPAPPPASAPSASIPRIFACNQFHVLGATTRDQRRRIVELADDKTLSGDAEVIAKARAELTHPKGRIAAELAWLPGVSPKRAAECLALVAAAPERAFELGTLPPLPIANLMAAALDEVDVDGAPRPWAEWLCHFGEVIDRINPDTVRRHINEDRTVAGFSEVSATDWIEAELAARRNGYKGIVHSWLDRFPSNRLLEVLTEAVENATAEGTKHPPRLIEDAVADYQLSAQPALGKAKSAVDREIEHIRVIVPRGEADVVAQIESLEPFARQWDRLARPAQLCAKARGEEHALSHQVAADIRSLGLEVANNHSMYRAADRITKLLQDVFAEVPVIAERVAEDASAIEDLLKKTETAAKNREEFERYLTYGVDIGMFFKSRLAISPTEVRWEGQAFPLDSVTRVRWGGVRRSVNGIPTGTSYHIAFGDRINMASVKLGAESTFNEFVARIWKAICVRLMVTYAEGLRAGKQYRFGDILLSDDGCEVTLDKMFTTERVKAPWSDIRIWSQDGNFIVGVESNNKARGRASYKDDDNTHVLEAMLRMFMKDNNARRVSEALLN